MSALASLLTPPIDASGGAFVLEQRVKLLSSTNNTLATLEAAINAWMIAQAAITDTFFGAPVNMGSTGTGNNQRFFVLIPYAYFVPPTA